MQETSTDGKGKGKGKECDDRGLKLPIDYIAEDLTCTIIDEAVGDLYQLNCQHFISSKALLSLQKPECPYCREEIKDAVYYLPQQTIYKHYIKMANQESNQDNDNSNTGSDTTIEVL